jgi:YidC/Oxa1 family membrane protein insertase
VLNFIYYPVSWILAFWHTVFGAIPFLGPGSGIAWALAVMFLVFTLRAILFKPFVSQVRSMRKMQQFAPEIQKLKKKYGNDKQRMAQEMQKLQGQHGVNPLGGCLPVLIQIPVFIGLFQVLKEFKPGKTENYGFGAAQVQSFLDADLFGAKLGAAIFPVQNGLPLSAYGTTVSQMLIVMIPLMIVAGVLTHITARHSVARQTEAQAGMQQTAIMNKVMLYLFPIGVVVGAPFLPLAILLYWVANNLWTLGQQYVVYRKIDREEAEQKQKAIEARQTRAPRPGQKPDRAGPGSGRTVDAEIANVSDVDGSIADGVDGSASNGAVQAAGAASNGSSPDAGTKTPARASGTSGAKKRGPQARNLRLAREGAAGKPGTSGGQAGRRTAAGRDAAASAETQPAGSATGSAGNGVQPAGGQPSEVKPGGEQSGTTASGAQSSGTNSGGTKPGGSGGGNQPSRRPVTAKKGRKRR